MSPKRLERPPQLALQLKKPERMPSFNLDQPSPVIAQLAQELKSLSTKVSCSCDAQREPLQLAKLHYVWDKQCEIRRISGAQNSGVITAI